MLDQGQYDAQLTFLHEDQSRDVVSNGNPGIGHSDFNSERAELRYGLSNDWLFGVAVSYDSQNNNQTDYTNPVRHFSNTSAQGGQNPNFWIKYGILDNASSPFTVSAQFLVAPHVGTNPGTGYRGELLTGWRIDDALRLYGTLNHNINTSDSTADRTNLDFGAYKDFSENFTLIPHVGCSEIYSTPTTKPNFQYGFGLSSDIQVAKNTYLIPDASYFRNNATGNPSGTFHASSSNGKDISIALYHLF